jgi:hypothetical protein
MPDTNRPAASEILRQTAVEQEAALLGKNEYREESAEYDATKVPTEIDGAKDERTKLTVMNMFSGDNEYKNPDGNTP